MYGTPHVRPFEYDTYCRYGKVWMPPRHIWAWPEHWYDAFHLNQSGARALSRWLFQKWKREGRVSAMHSDRQSK